MFGPDAGFLIFEYIRQIIKKVPFYECQVTDFMNVKSWDLTSRKMRFYTSEDVRMRKNDVSFTSFDSSVRPFSFFCLFFQSHCIK